MSYSHYNIKQMSKEKKFKFKYVFAGYIVLLIALLYLPSLILSGLINPPHCIFVKPSQDEMFDWITFADSDPSDYSYFLIAKSKSKYHINIKLDNFYGPRYGNTISNDGKYKYQYIANISERSPFTEKGFDDFIKDEPTLEQAREYKADIVSVAPIPKGDITIKYKYLGCERDFVKLN